MQADQWHERWRSGRIGFHSTEVARPLRQFWSTLKVPRGSGVFVPFCGKSLDLLWLHDQQHNVVGVELSEIAVESFFTENGIEARRVVGEAFIEYRAPGLRLFCGDLFNLSAEMLESCSAVYDRAALIAMPPELQYDYAAKLAQLTAPGTQTLLVTVEYPQEEMRGPPFSADFGVVNRLYSMHHDIQVLDRADIWATDPLRRRGITRLYEVCYRLTRL
jgi:thiopurine S-methyltransferase